MRIKFPHLWILVTPFALFYFGALLNILAISANHGMMPVAMPTVSKMIMDSRGLTGTIIDESHKVMEVKDHLKILCDWIQIPHDGTYSIGDMFIGLSDSIQNYFLGAWMALVASDYARN